jgi:hypothetical protein
VLVAHVELVELRAQFVPLGGQALALIVGQVGRRLAHLAVEREGDLSRARRQRVEQVRCWVVVHHVACRPRQERAGRNLRLRLRTRKGKSPAYTKCITLAAARHVMKPDDGER